MLNEIPEADVKLRKFPVDRELRSIEVKDYKLLINPNTQDVFIDSDKYKEEIAEYMTVEKDQVNLVGANKGAMRSKALCIQPTGSCNLDCTYCFCQYYESDRAHFMDFNVAKRAIDMFIPMNVKENDSFTIGFFGGEPTCAYNILRDITYYALGRLRNQKQLSFHMTTNATLIDDKWIKFFEDTGVKWTFIVSIDGPPEIHNKTRVTPNGKGSYDDALRGLKKLSEITDAITLRATFPPDEENMYVLDRIKHLNSLVHQGYANWVSVEPSQLSESKCLSSDRPIAFNDAAIERLQQEYYDVADWFIDGVSRLNIITEERNGVKKQKLDGELPIQNHVNKLLSRAMYKNLSVSECGGGVGYFTIDDEGNLYACHRLNGTKIGDVFSGIDERERARWTDNRIYNFDECMECTWRYTCGGPCRQNTYFNTGKMFTPRKSSCDIKQSMYKANLYILAKMYELGQYEKLKLSIHDPLRMSRKMPDAPKQIESSGCNGCDSCKGDSK